MTEYKLVVVGGKPVERYDFTICGLGIMIEPLMLMPLLVPCSWRRGQKRTHYPADTEPVRCIAHIYATFETSYNFTTFSAYF